MSQEVIDLLENGDKSVFITGKGGVGKSTLLRNFVETTKQNVVVCAPTGKAAINVGGQTIHSLFRIASSHMDDEEIASAAKRQSNVVKRADAIIIDECFPKGTLVDTPEGFARIEDVSPGDCVYNAIGIDSVVAVSRKKVNRCAKIQCGKTEIFCSENHPIFTDRGFVVACEIKPGDRLVETTSAMRLLQHGNNSNWSILPVEKILQSCLLNEMDCVQKIAFEKQDKRLIQKSMGYKKTQRNSKENQSPITSESRGQKIVDIERNRISFKNSINSAQQPGCQRASLETTKNMRFLRDNNYSRKAVAGNQEVLLSVVRLKMDASVPGSQSKDFHKRTSSKGRDRSQQIFAIRISRSIASNRPSSQPKPSERPRSCKEDFGNTSQNKAQATSNWWQWAGASSASEAVNASSWASLVARTCCSDKGIEIVGISDVLQNRYCKSVTKDRHRMRWGNSQRTKGERSRQEERFEIGFSRVESVEILEQDDSRLDQYREADGSLYFYDLQAKRHPTFSVNGLLVHNCSMLRVDLCETISRILQKCRHKPNLPFGGARLIVIGDVLQLPPIVQDDEANWLYSKYKTPYFFSAESMQDGAMEIIELMTVFRQKETAFIEILNGVRNGKITDFGLEQLNSRVNPNFGQPDGYITITPYNKKAASINEEKLKGLPGKETVYTATVAGEFSASQEPADKVLRLKEGAQVMFVKNAARCQEEIIENAPPRWVNGSMGIVTKCERSEVFVRMLDGPNDGKIFNVARVDWEIIKHEMVGDKIQKNVVGSFSQIPLKLGFAGTIHKIQGASVDKLILDLDRGAFDTGQAYVALSRCRTFDGLVLKSPVTRKDIQVDKRVTDYLEFMETCGFLRKVYSKNEDNPDLAPKKIDPLEVFRQANVAKAPFSALEDSQMRKLLCDPSLPLETLRDAISLCYDRLATGFFSRVDLDGMASRREKEVVAEPKPAIQIVGKDEEVILPTVSAQELAEFNVKLGDKVYRGPTAEELKAEWAKQSEKDVQKTLFSTKGVTVSDKTKKALRND